MFEKRKAVNFFRSYWEIAQELSEADRVKFYDAILKMLFTGEESELTGMSKFAFISQKHSLSKQVQGFTDIMKRYENELPTVAPTLPPTLPPIVPPTLQVQVQVKEEEEVELLKPTSIKVDWSALINQFNSITGKKTKVISPIVKSKILARLKEGYSKQDFLNAIENCYNDKWHKENNHKHLTLEFISRADKLERFSTQKT